MKKKSVFKLLILGMVLNSFFSQRTFAYEDTLVIESMQTIEGNVISIDTNRKRITARWMADLYRLKYQDIVLDVPDSCVITKNGETIELRDLEPNDSATVRFDSNAMPLPRASSITVTE